MLLQARRPFRSWTSCCGRSAQRPALKFNRMLIHATPRCILRPSMHAGSQSIFGSAFFCQGIVVFSYFFSTTSREKTRAKYFSTSFTVSSDACGFGFGDECELHTRCSLVCTPCAPAHFCVVADHCSTSIPMYFDPFCMSADHVCISL